MSVYRIIRGGVEEDYTFPLKQKYTNPNYRLGDVRDLRGKFLYTIQYIVCLYVVVWKSKYLEDPQEDLNLINPDKTIRLVKRFPFIYFLVNWHTGRGVEQY